MSTNQKEISMIKDETLQYGQWWTFALYSLMLLFGIAAALNMLHWHVLFFTTHAADLSGPAFLYIQARRSWQQGNRRFLASVIGRTPERAAGAFFIASAITELSQISYPHGIFSGRFDPLDIVAYFIGIGTCYVFEKMGVGMIPTNAA